MEKLRKAPLFTFLNVPLALIPTSKKMAPNKFVFEVPMELTKIELRNILSSMYNVKVLKVNTMIYDGKLKRGFGYQRKYIHRTNRYKKAIVTIASSDYVEPL